MKIYPAIDIMNGKVVRLVRGEKRASKIYGDPLKIAHMFSRYVDKVHIVDLDGAFEGKPRNLHIVKKIIKETGLRVQIGGGFRDYQSISHAYSLGVDNVIIGTRALDLDFLKTISRDFGGITVSLDTRNRLVSYKGWTKDFPVPVENLYIMLKNFVKRFIYTAIERDGTLRGAKLISRFWNNEEFIYAGGVLSLQDIILLKERGFSGVIVGKALYEGIMKIEDIMEVL